MKTPKFSIITVCYNAEKYMTDTINSVLEQSYSDYEYIIKDGESLDETMTIAQALLEKDKRATFIQGKDKGIYDAMNIAVQAAKGEYILFLNAGDVFADETVLQKASDLMDKQSADIYYGNVIEIEDAQKNISHLRVYTEKNHKLWYYSLGACLCHQAMFCKQELFKEKLFDLNYKVCADREWQLALIRNGAKAKSLDITIAKVLVDGFSTTHVSDLEKETEKCIRQYCGNWYFFHQIIRRIKKNKWVYAVIHKAEKRVSCK